MRRCCFLFFSRFFGFSKSFGACKNCCFFIYFQIYWGFPRSAFSFEGMFLVLSWLKTLSKSKRSGVGRL